MKYRRETESIMDLAARGYTDTQLRLIADFLASLPGDGEDGHGEVYDDEESDD